MTIKTHGHSVGRKLRDKSLPNFNGMAEVNDTAILIIRNPFKTFIGIKTYNKKSKTKKNYFLLAQRHFDSGGHNGFASEDKFIGPAWETYTKDKSQEWLSFYTDWLENQHLKNILVLHYENIKENLE